VLEAEIYFWSNKKAFADREIPYCCALMRPFQIIFNPTSAAELSKMPKELQLYILGEFRGLPQEVLKADMEKYGQLERAGKRLLRFRLGEYRVYFERNELGVLVYRILNKNTLKDFLYRSNLPIREDEALQQNPKFWELIEAAKTSSTKQLENLAA
jgi:mRNA-degrading endonuclease RelE of RelBE toxin-antitoxin system